MRYTVILLASVISIAWVAPAWADEAKSQNQVRGTDTTDIGVRKRPGRTTYGDITLKRGVVAPADDGGMTQIDPPSLQLDSGPVDTDSASTTRAKSSKPREIVVVGSKAKKQSHEASHVVQQNEGRSRKTEVRGWDPKDKKAIEGTGSD